MDGSADGDLKRIDIRRCVRPVTKVAGRILIYVNIIPYYGQNNKGIFAYSLDDSLNYEYNIRE